MPSKAVFRKNGRGLWAQCDASQEILNAIKDGADVMVSVHVARNPKHHRLFFAVLNEIAGSGAWPYDAEALLEWVKHRVGHVVVIEAAGRRIIRSKSINFESMPQDKFRAFFDRAIYFLCTEILGEAEWEQFRDDLVNRLEQRYRDPREQEAA